MGGHSILINEPAGLKKPAPVQDFMLGWRLLLVLGWLFTMVGLLNAVLLWVPLKLGVPEYEFASVAAALDGMPLAMMGMTLALAGSRARGNDNSAMAAIILLCVVAVLVLGAGLLYWLNVPLALQAVSDPIARIGIKKSIVKVTAQATLYPAAMVYLALIGRRRKVEQFTR